MNMKSRKVIAFILNYVTLVIVAAATIIFTPEAWGSVFIFWVSAVMFNSFIFVSFVLIKDYIRSKHFRPELYDAGEK